MGGGVSKTMGYVWDPGHRAGGPQVFHLHPFVLLGEGEAWISLLLPSHAPPSSSSDLGDWVVHLSFVRVSSH